MFNVTAVTAGPPERYTARVDVEVDTPNSQAPLSTVGLQAAVGTARLHAPRDMDVSIACPPLIIARLLAVQYPPPHHYQS